MYAVSPKRAYRTLLPWSLRSPDGTSFCLSGDPVSRARRRVGVGIALSMRADSALSDRISIARHLCAIWLGGYVHANSCRLKRRCLFVEFVYAFTDCSSPEVKDKF